jgi:thymidylate kinase
MKSALIAFCGIDGSGKSSLVRRLSERLPADDVISVANRSDIG